MDAPESPTVTGASRVLAPLDAPPSDRPKLPSQACAACGSLLDPLRAARVLAFDDGFRFLCGPACVTEFRRGTRHRRVPTPEPKAETSGFLPVPAMVALGATSAPRERALWVGAAAVGLAILCGSFATMRAFALAATLWTALAVAAALRASWVARDDIGWVAWALGPTGVLLAAGAAYAAVVTGHGSWLLIEGAALSAGAIVARAWFDAEAREPIAHALHQLSESLPDHVHVPIQDAADPLAMSVERKPIGAVRAGDEVIVRKGDVVGVDGLVRAGSGKVLAHLGATASIPREAGDPVLAGARVTRGALRILATRVGDDRAVLRVAGFGAGSGRAPAPIARVSDGFVRWGGLGTLGLAVVVLVLAESADPSARWSAAAAVLLAAPLLAVRRAAQSPLLAAAASAVTRGVVLQSAAALDTAGRVTVVALSPRGVLTEGKPDVVDVHVIGEGDADAFVALAASAEEAAGDDPIACAIRRHAQHRRLVPADVRRATHLPGRGVTAMTPEGLALFVGSRRALLDAGIGVAATDAEAARAEQRGRTPVLIALDGRVRAVVSVEDALRIGARPAVQRLFDLDAEVVLLTGDQRGAVGRVAGALDVTHVRGELWPEERGREVADLRKAGDTVAAIGVLPQDDAMLAAADTGIVLGQAGSGTNERAITLVGDDVRDAADALWIAHAAREATMQVMGLAAIGFALIVAAAATGLVVPGIAAVLSVAIDAYGVRAGARLLRRIALRLPARV
jgi:cation transport ATPase